MSISFRISEKFKCYSNVFLKFSFACQRVTRCCENCKRNTLEAWMGSSSSAPSLFSILAQFKTRSLTHTSSVKKSKTGWENGLLRKTQRSIVARSVFCQKGQERVINNEGKYFDYFAHSFSWWNKQIWQVLNLRELSLPRNNNSLKFPALFVTKCLNIVFNSEKKFYSI